MAAPSDRVADTHVGISVGQHYKVAITAQSHIDTIRATGAKRCPHSEEFDAHVRRQAVGVAYF